MMTGRRVKQPIWLRKARLADGACPLHGNPFETITYTWLRCPHADCGILARRLDGTIVLAPGWLFLLDDDLTKMETIVE